MPERQGSSSEVEDVHRQCAGCSWCWTQTAPARRRLRRARSARGRRWPASVARSSTSAGGPNATWRPLRQSTRSKPRARCRRRGSRRAAPGPRRAARRTAPRCARRWRVDACERLVEQQHRRVLHERAREQRALALAARERAEARVRLRRRGPTRASAARRRGAVGAARPAATSGRARARPSARRRARSRGSRGGCGRSGRRRRCGPASATLPADGVSSPVSARKRVVLPPPLGPSTPSDVPAGSAKETSRRTGRAAVADREARGLARRRSSSRRRQRRRPAGSAAARGPRWRVRGGEGAVRPRAEHGDRRAGREVEPVGEVEADHALGGRERERPADQAGTLRATSRAAAAGRT